MKGVVLLGDRNIEIREMPVPEPAHGEVLVKMMASGICGSDLRIIYQVPGGRPWNKSIGGHEPCGVVAAVGEGVDYYKPGDRVMVMWVTGCGHCPACFAGDLDHCETRLGAYGWGLNGGFADYMVARAISLVPMPEGLSFASGAFLTCAATTSYQAIKRLAPCGLDTVAVFGLGPVGLSGVVWLRAMGARVIGVDLVPERLALAQKLGASDVIDAAKADALQVIRGLTRGRGADIALDFSGVPKARVDALRCLRVRGKMGFVGEGGDTVIDIHSTLLVKSLTAIGSRIFDKPTLAEAARHVAERNLPLDDIVTHRFSIEEATEAFRLFDEGHTGKIVFEWA